MQKQRHKKYEQVCGCPYTSVGGELATQDKKVRLTTRNLIDRHVKYLTSTIADAVMTGVAEPADPDLKARLVHAFVVGLLLRAKIYNDLKILNHLEEAIFSLIGAKLRNCRIAMEPVNRAGSCRLFLKLIKLCGLSC